MAIDLHESLQPASSIDTQNDIEPRSVVDPTFDSVSKDKWTTTTTFDDLRDKGDATKLTFYSLN